MRSFLPLLLAFASAPLGLFANTDVKSWTLQSGERFSAELVSYDEAAAKVTLKFQNVTDRVYEFSAFSVVDQAWLTEWLELEEAFDTQLKTLGGRVEHRITTGKYPTELFIYYPSSAKQRSSLPCLILFHPGGKAARCLKRHFEAAENTGLMLVACGTFRNNRDEAVGEQFLNRFREVFPQILALPQVDARRVFMGGTSGGAARAFSYSAKIDHPWAGIYSNGGWLGGAKNYDLPYARGMRVAMVNGHLDQAANHFVEPDSAVLIARGVTIGVIAFEGAHQEPPVHSQMQAFRWLLGEGDVAADPGAAAQ